MMSQEEQWREEQIELKKQLILEDAFRLEDIQYIGGFDISFVVGDNETACAAFVILKYPELEVVYKECLRVKMDQPYIAGFLAFREVKHLVKLYENFLDQFGKSHKIPPPQVSLIDGNGILHYHGFGLACHLGVILGIPTIGVGKSILCVDGLSKESVKNGIQEESFHKLIGESGYDYGRAVIGSKNCINPVFVSPGHMVSRDTSAQIVQNCCVHKIPEPVRQADMLSREWLRNNY